MKRPLLTQEQIEKVRDAVGAAERNTSGEIVPVILRQSDYYPGARWRMAIAVAGLTGFIIYLLRPELAGIWILWTEVPALFVGYLLGSIAPLQRLFLATSEMDDEVHERALEIFQFKNLRGTRDRTGILILVSLLEHRVQILADQGIDSIVPPGTWDHVVQGLLKKIRAGNLTEGLCLAISECGAILSEKLPGRHDDTDELSNTPIVEN